MHRISVWAEIIEVSQGLDDFLQGKTSAKTIRLLNLEAKLDFARLVFKSKIR